MQDMTPKIAVHVRAVRGNYVANVNVCRCMYERMYACK